MAIEDKVDLEMKIDRMETNGRKKKGVLAVVAKHGVETPFNSEISAEILAILGHESYYRSWEWHKRAVAELKELPAREQAKLSWKGSDEVADLASYRAKRDEEHKKP
jgi:hypothetical protein